MARLFSERLLTSLALLLTGAALAPATLAARDDAMGPAFDPAFFPLIVLGAWVAFAALVVLSELRAGPAGGSDAAGGVRWGKTLAAAVGMLAFALAFRWLGFFIGGALLSLLILGLAGRFRWFETAAFALVAPGMLTALFNHVLKMPLPSSPVAWWF